MNAKYKTEELKNSKERTALKQVTEYTNINTANFILFAIIPQYRSYDLAFITVFIKLFDVYHILSLYKFK